MISALSQGALDGVMLLPLWQLELVFPGKWQRGQQPAEPLLFLTRGHRDGATIGTGVKHFKGVWVENHGVNFSERQHSLKRHIENNIVTSLKDWTFFQTTSRPSITLSIFFFCMGYAVIFGCCDLKYLRHSFTSCIFFYLSHNTQSLCIKIVYWSDV